jgi:hypothetical protein
VAREGDDPAALDRIDAILNDSHSDYRDRFRDHVV